MIKKLFLNGFICLLLLLGNEGISQENRRTNHLGILGNTGLAFVPTAYITPESQISLGFSHLPKEVAFVTRSKMDGVGEHVKFLNLGYLSFLEITIRLTKPYGTENTFGIGDRSYFFKIKALKEKNIDPQ
ncbi:MAG: hypothetical protein AB8G86_26775 [Saprospiraceae bacterium]